MGKDTPHKKKAPRLDHQGAHRLAFERNKKEIFATQTVCGICGKPVDFSLKYPDPYAPCIDHIIPIAKGGHPSDLDNLQLAHWKCNRAKGEKLRASMSPGKSGAENTEGGPPAGVDSNRVLPLSFDWENYKSK